ncbi:MAG: hypothetical protein AB7I18_01660 [Candidatus Berkiella sp.]
MKALLLTLATLAVLTVGSVTAAENPPDNQTKDNAGQSQPDDKNQDQASPDNKENKSTPAEPSQEGGGDGQVIILFSSIKIMSQQ